jgi:DNA-binding LacI/PurR family transcriptional regulator
VHRPDGAPVSNSRVNGIAQRARKRGALRIGVIHSNFSFEQGNAAMLRHASCGKLNIDPLLCAND